MHVGQASLFDDNVRVVVEQLVELANLKNRAQEGTSQGRQGEGESTERSSVEQGRAEDRRQRKAQSEESTGRGRAE
jgi:hypothetical protein